MRNITGMGLLLAVAAFGASAVVFGATAVDAIRTEDRSLRQVAAPMAEEPEMEIPPPGSDAESAETNVPIVYSEASSYPEVSNDELLGAVNQDLFQPDRTPTPERYLFPSERAAPVMNSRNDRRRREPSLRIVGTAIAGNRALAMVQPEDSIPFAVLLGEEVDGYILAGITEEFVTLVGNDEEFIYPVVEPDRGRSGNRDRNDRERAESEDMARQLSERAQQILQGLQRGQMMRGGGEGMPQSIQFQGTPMFRDSNMRIVLPARGVRPGGGGGSGGGGMEDLP
jgi:hypothetical protein